MSKIEKAIEKASKLRESSPPVVQSQPEIRQQPVTREIPRSYQKHEEKEVHLRDYLEIVIRRKWIVILFLISVVTTGTLASFLMTPQYRATTTIKMYGGKTKLVQFEDVYKAGRKLETEYNVLKSRNLAKRVVTKSPLLKAPQPTETNFMHSIISLIPIFGDKNGQQVKENDSNSISIGTIMKGLEIVPIKKSTLVNIQFTSEDPVFAANAANKVADEYLKFTEESKLEPTQLGGIRLRKEVEDMGAKLEASEKQLNEYVANSQFLFTRNDKDYENLLSQKYSSLTQELNSATSERISREAIFQEVNKSGVDYSIVLDNSMIRSLTMEYANLESEYFNLLKIHKPEYPKMLRLKDQIERLKNRIEVEEQKIINTLHSDYKLALKKENLLSSTIEKLRMDVTAFQQNMFEFQTLKREVETNRDLYSTLLQRLKEVDISAALTESDVQILDRAQTPTTPYKPNIPYNIVLSLILGLMGGIFLAFSVEYFDNSIKNDDDIEKISHLPVIGKVPTTRTDPKELILSNSNGNGNSNSRAVFDKAVFSEAFRYLSTRIQFSNARSPKQVLITSPMAQEGKTIISVSIARSLMTSREKGIIVDADLRRPDIHTLFKLDNTTGLSSFLSGESEFDTLIKKTPFERLDAITAGPVPANPAELFNSSRMNELVDALSAAYDYIIFDSAPVLGMSDSLILSTVVDSVILVVKAHSTPRDALVQANKALDSVNANSLGFILNGIDLKTRYSCSSDYYCSPYLHSDKKQKKLS